MLVAVRHARTSFNEDGKERLRGWLPIPLSSEGMEESFETAKKLKDLKLPITDFHTSPLKRAVQTATEISNELGKDFNKTDSLKDWNTGDFTGEPVESTLPKIHKFIDNNTKTIPGGESFNDFYNRTYPFLKKLIESDDTHLAVTHNRVITLLKALVANGGESPDKSVLKKKGPIEPGGIIMIDPNWEMSVIHDPEEKVSSV